MNRINNTAESFFSKWKNNPDLAFSETLREGSDIRNWILNRNGFQNTGELESFLKNKRRILDAGCGNGRVTALLRTAAPAGSEVVGIDLVASEIAQKNLDGAANTFFFQKDLMHDLSDLGTFDFIYSQEVLHHTENARSSFLNLVHILENEGEIAIYVYKKKAPLREYSDDYIRNKIAGLSYEEAMKTCDAITRFGQELHKQNVKITVPALEVMGIEAGEYDVQRFVYHFFFKCFWSDSMNFHDNSVINFDWYHPQNCSRHTLEEVREWFYDAGLTITHEFTDFYGITVRGKKTHTH
ncbi:MAG TPA: class I SAM-dependent methyltransferase [Bacteroidia bacterium]|nr:class I SAM-dependent methyltransferase [Bacteroidia bacterium]